MKNERTESLTAKELKLFLELTAGYGSITDAAVDTGLHHQTIRSIRKLGYGKPETISIIREKLLYNKTTLA
jgi:hypothetical protein